MDTPTETSEPQDYLDNIVYSATDALVLGMPMNLLGKISYREALASYEKRFSAWKGLVDEVLDTKSGTVQDK